VILFFATVISRIAKLPVIVVRRRTVQHASLKILVSVVFVGTSVGVRNAFIQNVLLVAFWEYVNTNTKLWADPPLDSPADPDINYSDYDSDYSGLSQFPPMFSPSPSPN
jgi:hypothetical protein